MYKTIFVIVLTGFTSRETGQSKRLTEQETGKVRERTQPVDSRGNSRKLVHFVSSTENNTYRTVVKLDNLTKFPVVWNMARIITVLH